jgi:hypothetical protein
LLFFCYSIAFGLLFACSSQGHQNVQLLFARFKITPELLKKNILTLPNGCLTRNYYKIEWDEDKEKYTYIDETKKTGHLPYG